MSEVRSVPDVKKPAAWLDENGAVIVNTDYSQGCVRPDGAIPDSWTPLVPAAQQRIAALHAALRMYGWHLPECDYMQESLPCSCGFMDALAEVKP